MGKVAWSWSSLKCTGALCPSLKAGLCHQPRMWLVGVWLRPQGLKEEQDQKELKAPKPGCISESSGERDRGLEVPGNPCFYQARQAVF